MTKHLRFLFIALLMAVWTGGWAQTTVDFSSGLPSDWEKTAGSTAKQTKGLQLMKNTTIESPVYSSVAFSKMKITLSKSSGGTTFTIYYQIGNSSKVTIKQFSKTQVQTAPKDYDVEIPSAAQVKGCKFIFTSATSSYYLKTIEFTPASNKTSTTTKFGDNYSKKTFTFVNGVLDGFEAPQATVTPTEAQSEIEYWSDNEDVVKVGTNGTLTFGTVFDTEAKIYAGIKDGNETYEASSDYYTVINKSNLTATSLSFNGLTGEGVVLTEGLLNGAAFTGYAATETNSVPGKITYSADGEVATVNADNGQVTINATKYGTSTITATFTPNDAATYLQSTASYTIQNTKKIDESTIVFDFTSDKYNSTVIGTYADNTGTKRTFPSVAGKNYEFTLTTCMYNDQSLQLKKSEGILVSPTFNSFPNGYKVVVTYNNNFPTLSSNECKDAKADINSTAKTVTIELPSPSATFTINASTEGVTNIDNITLTAIKSTPALSFANASVDVALEDKTTTVQTITTAEGFDGHITYESSDNKIATVERTTITLIKEGEVDIIAKSDATETYAAGTASYKLVIKSNRKDPELAFKEESYNIDVKVGKFFSADHLKNPNSVSVEYAIDPASENVEITADGEVKVKATGEYTITAKFKGNDTYKPTTAKCKLVVTDGIIETKNVTFEAGVDMGSGTSQGANSMKKESVTISSNNAAFANSNDYRFYASKKHSFSTNIGTITKIEFFFDASYGDYNFNDLKLEDNTNGKFEPTDKSATWTGSAKEVIFTNSKQVRATKIIVTLAVPQAKDYIFYETSDNNSVENYENANVTLKRSNLVTDSWNTFCVPFAISAEEIADTWGEGTQLRTFDSMSGTSTMNFKIAESIEAGKPYLVKPTKVTTGDLTFNGVQTVVMTKAENTVGENGFYMVGTYNTIKLAEDGSHLFLSANNEFKRPQQNSEKMKGMRVYFKVPANTKPAELRANIDGVETGINAIEGIEGNTTAPVYNLQGQCVGNSLRSLAPGIYVQGGKKYVVK